MDEIIGAVLSLITVQTGRVVVWLISLGKWRGEPLLGREGRIHSAAGALSFIRDGTRVLTESGLWLVGLVFYIALFAFILTMIATA